ncbi:hypothetical protein LAJ57_13550, partial [Streptococcus pneumoniae]|uniref:hypothetical protein n=1 Tax=Streptococcus pneumoniae TaxID=1313 RepID=UPI001CBF11DE
GLSRLIQRHRPAIAHRFLTEKGPYSGFNGQFLSDIRKIRSLFPILGQMDGLGLALNQTNDRPVGI